MHTHRKPHTPPFALRTLGWLLAACGTPLTHAQVIADPNAAATQRPTVLLDAQGRPLINIQTPGATGVSRNTYRQFDVGSNGVVLNNARTSNPWLAQGEASLILNEINSSNPSYLNGPITVSGRRADVVIANPSGLSVSGLSFVNASRATLATGTPVLTNGALSGFNITGGRVEIGAKGLNATGTDYTALLARSVVVNGRIDAKDLAIITGPQTVPYGNGAMTPLSSTGPTPAWAIDSSSLGGMYAGKITLLSNEAGMGIRTGGTIQASDQIVVTAEGYLDHQGTMLANTASLATLSGNVNINGKLEGRFLSISSGNNVTVSGSGITQTGSGGVIINARNSFNLAPKAIISESNRNGLGGPLIINAGGNIDLTSASIIVADGDVRLTSQGRISLTDAFMRSTSAQASAMALQGMNISGSALTGRSIHLETGSAFQPMKSTLSIIGGSLNATDATNLISSGDLWLGNATGSTVKAGDLVMRSGQNLLVLNGSQLSITRNVSAEATSALQFRGVTGNSAASGKRVTLSAGGDTTLTGGSVLLYGAQLTAGGAVSIGSTTSEVKIDALPHAGGADHQPNEISAGKDLTVFANQGDIWLRGARATAQNIRIVGNGITSIAHAENKRPDGSVQAVASSLTAKQDVTLGTLNPAKTLQITGSNINAEQGSLSLQGGNQILITHAQNKTAAGVSSDQGSNLAGASVSMQAPAVWTQAANIQARAGDITIKATSGVGSLAPGISTPTLLNATGNIALAASGNLWLNNTTANAGRSLAATSEKDWITSTGALLTAGDMLSMSSYSGQSHLNTQLNGGAISIFNQTNALRLQGAQLRTTATRSPEVSGLSGDLSVESGGTLAVDAATRLNAGRNLSLLTAIGNLRIIKDESGRSGDGVILSASQFSTGRDLTLGTRNGSFSFSGAAGSQGPDSSTFVSLNAIGNLTLIGNAFDFQGTRLTSGGAMTITATQGGMNLNANAVTAQQNGFNNSYWDTVRFNAGGNLDLNSVGDIALSGAVLESNGALSLKSAASITAIGRAREYTTTSDGYRKTNTTERNRLVGRQGATLAALGGNLTLAATDIQASGGTATLQSMGNMTLDSVQERELRQSSQSGVDKSWFGLRRKYWRNYQNYEWLTAKPVKIEAADIKISAAGNFETLGTVFQSGSNLTLQTGGNTAYRAAQNQYKETFRREESVSFIGINFGSSSDQYSQFTLSPQPTVLQSWNDILSQSGGDQLLQGTRVIYGGSATFQAGVGEKARADARIILEGVTTTVQQSRTRESNYVVWQKQLGQGSTTQTLNLPSFNGPTPPKFSAPGGLLVQIPQASDFRAQIQTLATTPGMGYLTDLTARKDVNWQPVKLAFDQWSYKQSGLTPAGAALLSVAVAWASGGLGSNFLGTTGGYTSAAANAAFSSLASQASIALVNNRGNIGKALEDLGKSNIVKATLAAALTAGAMDKVTALPGMNTLANSPAFTDKLTFNLINAGGRALTTAAITGGNIESAIREALLGALVDTAHGELASRIKVIEHDYLAHKLAHALAGCAAGTAAGGACRDGAIGGAVSEIVAKLMPPENRMFYTPAEREKLLAYGKLIAGGISAYAGGNAQTAITAADTTLRNNALFVVPLVYLLATAAGYTTIVGAGNPVEGLKVIGQGSDPLSQALALGTTTAVSLSMDRWPQETTATLNFLAFAGSTVEATVTYVDSATGKVVSTQWNSLPEGTRHALIGAGKITSVVLPATSVTKVRAGIANVTESMMRRLELAAQNALIRSGGMLDNSGRPLIALEKLTNAQKSIAGEIFGEATVRQMIPNGQKIGRMPGLGESGIDDLYKVSRADVDYVIIEYKFVGDYKKTGSGGLGSTLDGRQGSEGWVLGGDRLEKSVGRDNSEAVKLAIRSRRTETWVVTTRPNGSTEIEVLDAYGKAKPVDTSKIILPKVNLSGARP